MSEIFLISRATANDLVECFRPVESKPTSSKLVLEVKQSGVPATDSPKKQGSFMSALSSPLSIGKGSKNGKEADGNYYAKALPESLRDLKSLTITFTDTKGNFLFYACAFQLVLLTFVLLQINCLFLNKQNLMVSLTAPCFPLYCSSHHHPSSRIYHLWIKRS